MSDDHEQRLTRLEAGFDEIRANQREQSGKLDTIIHRLGADSVEVAKVTTENRVTRGTVPIIHAVYAVGVAVALTTFVVTRNDKAIDSAVEPVKKTVEGLGDQARQAGLDRYTDADAKWDRQQQRLTDDRQDREIQRLVGLHLKP